MRRQALLAVALAIVSGAFAGNAQAANEPQNFTAVQHDGYVTLSWDPVAGATDYQIERTPVDATKRRPAPR